jgi:hypothetical protein
MKFILSEDNTTADDIAAVFDDEVLPTDKEYKKDFEHLLKLWADKHSIEIDVHTSWERRWELFLKKKSNNYITGMLEFIDKKLEVTINSIYALKDIPKDHINHYIKKYEKLSAQEMKYENMKQKLIEYYTVNQ